MNFGEGGTLASDGGARLPYNPCEALLHTAKLVPQAIRSTSGVVAQAIHATPSHRTGSARLAMHAAQCVQTTSLAVRLTIAGPQI
eukprot:7379095-Prymnesium_polylepis.1